jgi:two-component system, OmpR family, sensor histidine kinase KdpD
MGIHRPDPDELLRQVEHEAAKAGHGKLKIFLGAAAGVGKTYAMLDAAHLRQKEGVDVLAGYIEPHARPETMALLAGLEVLPPLLVEYKSTTLPEFDLDGALKRHPALILIDELAHTNAPGSRHAKRWQDVEELLDAGINVYTTVNIQHIESLNDVVAQITGVIVRETVPDSVVNNADEIELIDLPPEELLKRFQEGKIYRADQAEHAMRRFFRPGNLMALRELALRQTASQVDEQMQAYKRAHAISDVWAATEKMLVCVSPSPLSARLVRGTARMAAGFHAGWYAVYVENPGVSAEDRARVAETLRLAEKLGAETTTLSGHSVSQEILTFARARNINKIVVGKPIHSIWQDFIRRSVLNDLVRSSGEIDVYVISGEGDETTPHPIRLPRPTSNLQAYINAIGIVALCTGIAALLFPYFEEGNIIMVYLMGILIAAVTCGRGPSSLASFVSVATFDFFFVSPYHTFAVSDTEYLLTFVTMLAVALTISNLTSRLKHQAEFSRLRELRTTSLYELSRDFARSLDTNTIVQIAIRHIGQVFDGGVLILLPDESNQLNIHAAENTPFSVDSDEKGVAQWVYEHGHKAGLNTDTLPGAKGLYLPLGTAYGAIGVLGIYPRQKDSFLLPEQLHLLETFVNQTALAIERTQLALRYAQVGLSEG